MIPSPPSRSFINPHQIAGAARRQRPMSPFREGKGAIPGAFKTQPSRSFPPMKPSKTSNNNNNKKSMPPPCLPPNDSGSYLGWPGLPTARCGCFRANLPSSRRISTQPCLATKPYLVPAKEIARLLARLAQPVKQQPRAAPPPSAGSWKPSRFARLQPSLC